MRTLRRAVFVVSALAIVGNLTPAAAQSLPKFSIFRGDQKEPEIIDPQRYRISFLVTGLETNPVDEKRLREASNLFTLADRPTSGQAGLIRMAHEDYARILAELFEQGRFGGSVSIRLAGREAAEVSPIDKLPAPTNVVVRVNAGVVFRFGELKILPQAEPATERDDAVPLPREEGFLKGEPAFAGRIRAAQELSVEAWRQQGYALAKVADARVIADHGTSLIDATLLLDPGPRLTFGETRIVGSENLDKDYLIYMADLPRGEEFDPDNMEAAKLRFARLGVFRSVVVSEEPSEIAGDELPVVFLLSDKEPRRIGFGATISNVDGIGLEAFWLHRNLFGKAQQLRFDAKIAGIERISSPDQYDYFLGGEMTFPGVLTPDTDFFVGLAAESANFDTFEETSLDAEAGFTRVFSPQLTGDVSAFLSRSRFDDDLGIRRFSTIGLKSSLIYDGRNSRTDPTEGYFFRAEVKPTYELEFSNFGLRGTLEGRTYRSLLPEDRLVVAGRLEIGTFTGSTISQISPDNLFFAGGGNSVRGYGFNSIGVTTPGGSVVGGRSLIDGSVELRTRINERIGAAVFTDFGLVDTDTLFSGNQNLLYSFGLGIRYYTLLGPIRFDVAVPQKKRSGDPNFAFYIGIGQAF